MGARRAGTCAALHSARRARMPGGRTSRRRVPDGTARRGHTGRRTDRRHRAQRCADPLRRGQLPVLHPPRHALAARRTAGLGFGRCLSLRDPALRRWGGVPVGPDPRRVAALRRGDGHARLVAGTALPEAARDGSAVPRRGRCADRALAGRAHKGRDRGNRGSLQADHRAAARSRGRDRDAAI